MNTREITIKTCLDSGIEEVGIIPALPFSDILPLLSDFDLDGFCEKDVQKRVDPALTLNGARSIICALFPYAVGKADKGHEKSFKIISGDVFLGEDYHNYVLRVLGAVCIELKAMLGGIFLPFCDTGPLVDKEIAVRTGLCKYGINTLAINEKYGSYHFIGYILTDVFIEPSEFSHTAPLFDTCNTCGNCISACPTGAITEHGLNHKKCVSYISQKKGQLTDSEFMALDGVIYGCHICQNVCPANDRRNFTRYVSPCDIDEVSGMTNRQFKEKYNTAAAWIGKKAFLRNGKCR